MTIMKIIFFGSDDFAQSHLDALIGSGHEIVACVTQPDRAKGRGMKVVFSPIKECADSQKIPLLQPQDVCDPAFINELKKFESDLFVVIAYGKILPADVLSIPKTAALNVHGSLLPKYRGAAPINWAIINGEKESGLSIIRMNPQMDAGDVCATKAITIKPEDTSVTLRQKMMHEGPALLLEAVKDLADGTCVFNAQDESLVSKAPKLTKELGKIDWNKSAEEIERLIRGLLPWPGAYTFYQDKQLKILEASIVDGPGRSKPGEVSEINKKGFVVTTAKKSLLVAQVHLQSSKPMDAASFIRGHKLETGFSFL